MTNFKRFLGFTLVFLVPGLVLVFSPSAHGSQVLNVGLSRFEAIPVETGVLLEWDVETELGTAGYTIKRGLKENNEFDYLPNPEGEGELFILAEGGPTVARSYSTVDETAVLGTMYTYQLIEITTASNEQLQAEVTITFNIEPTNTPLIFDGNLNGPGGSSGEQEATATPQPTQTAVLTSPSETVATSTPLATRSAPTPLPTAAAANEEATDGVSLDLAQPTIPAVNEAYPGDDASLLDSAAVAAVDEAGARLSTGEKPQSENDATLDAYPAPPIPGSADSETVADPAAAVAMELLVEGQSPTQTESPTAITIIAGTIHKEKSEGGFDGITAQAEEDEPASASSSRLLLWLAFIIALAVFSASVIGAIILYSRRRPTE